MTTISAKDFRNNHFCLISTRNGYVDCSMNDNASLENAMHYRTVSEFVVNALRFWNQEELDALSPFVAIDAETGEIIDEFEIKEG